MLECRVPLFAKDGRVRAWALVDVGDFAELRRYRWYLMSGKYAARFVRGSGGKSTYMHRQLLGLELGDPREGDHINRDRLDNRRANLRIVDQTGQMQNRSSWGASGIRGVSLVRKTGKWRADAKLAGRTIYLGSFATKEEAGVVARQFRLEHMSGAVD